MSGILRNTRNRWFSAGNGVRLMLLLLLASCTGGNRKEMNRRVTLRRNDDAPYGARIAYEGLAWIFPDADISVLSLSPQAFTSGEEKKAIITLATDVEVSPAEVTAIMNFVGEGNQLFISSFRVSDTLLRVLGIRTSYKFRFMDEQMDSLAVGIYNPMNANYKEFSYPGDDFDSYITKYDSQYTSVLGRNASGRPNFVRISYKGGGAIYLHFAPMAFTNFFLLHKQNIAYYENALSYLPATTKQVIWNDYFRYGNRGRSTFSALQYIFGGGSKTRGLAMAASLLLLLFLLIYLFDSKRRQRMIPVITPLRNTSLDFVRTIGRLYFQRRDNRNLATKMAVHFQDQVRTRYHLPVAALDEDFVKRLAYRTGYSKEELQGIVDYMQHLPAKGFVPDEELENFHRQLEAFYKHT